MGKTLDAATTSQIREEIDRTVQSGVVPGILYYAVDQDGDYIFSHVSGNRGIASKEPNTRDTVFWIASLTKLITSIACMQLVEQGQLRLDDPEQVAQLAPELSTMKVLERDGSGGFILEDQNTPITLRMLLTHTAGFGYAFDDRKLHDWALPVGIDDFSADLPEFLRYPLVNQPGTQFQYGVGLDWVGILVERVAKTTLEEYIQKNILQPLSLQTVTFLPSSSMISRLAYMHQREPDGKLCQSDHVYRRPLVAHTEEEKRGIFHMGGAGCFASIGDYCQIVATLLNNGINAKAKAQLLKRETVEAMFQDQIPGNPRHGNAPWQTAKPRFANSSPIFPVAEDAKPDDDTYGWGLSFGLSLRASATGRAVGSAFWGGLPNLSWFADRENGLGGVLATQVLPYGDQEVMRLSERVEAMIYKAYIDGE